MGIPWRYLKSRGKLLQSSFGLPSCIPVYLLKTLKSKSAIFYIITSKKYTILKRSSGSSGTSWNIHTIKPKHGWRLPREGLQILRFILQGLQEHEQQIEYIWTQQNFCFLLNIFLRLKYQKNMAPKKSKVKKPKVKKRVAQPAKGIIERTICAHPMLKRVQKEVRELKKKSTKKYKK